MNRIVLVLIFWMFALTGVRGQEYWEEAKGPYGGSLSLWPSNSNVLYGSHYKSAYHEEGLYRSTDYGEHWDRFVVPLVDTSSLQEALCVGHTGVFYKVVALLQNSSVTRKLYRSLDEGASWSLLNSNLPITALSETQTGVLIGINPVSQAIYRSVNGGIAWQLVHQLQGPISSDGIMISLPDGKVMLADGAGFNEFYFSENNGLSWVERTLPDFFAIPYLVPSGAIFSVSKLGSSVVRRSLDFGVTWEISPIPLVIGEEPSSILGLNNERLLLSTNFRLFFSDDNGSSWQPMPDFPEPPQGLMLGRPLANGHLLGTRKGAFFRSADGGETWSFSSIGIRQADTRQLTLLTDSLQLAVTTNGLWRTENAGEDWTRILADTSKGFFYSKRPLAVISPDTFVVSLGAKLWASTDSGVSYTEATPAGGLGAEQRSVFSSSGVLFCSGVPGVLRSDDLGETWTNVIPGARITTLVEHPDAGLFAFTTPINETSLATLRRSTDAGVSWTEISTPAIPPSQRLTLYVDNYGKIYITGYHEHSVQLAVSSDEGATWEYHIIPDIYAGFDLAVNDIGLIYTSAGTDIQILTSADGGKSWYFLPVYDDNTSLLNGLEVSPSGRLYIVPSSGTLYRSTASTELGAFIRGHVRRDADAECSTPDAQEPLHNWAVTLEGENTFYNSTGTDGSYSFFVDTGAYTVQVTTPQNLWWGLCDSLQTVQSDSLFSADTVDFAALALADCPLISVSVGVPRLRRCFDNNVYVQYCNQGSETADSARVDVILDDYLEFISADLPHEALGNNTFRFQLGAVLSGECGQLGLVVHVNCDSTVLGQTHCITAHGYPDTICIPVPDWSGATVVAEAECQDTVVALRLRNIGPVQSQVLPYIIIEDDVVLMQGQDDYLPGGMLVLERPANGHTWRIESQQEPGHPFSSVAVAFLEGCGGFESLGFVNQFEVNTFEYSWDRVCLENIGSYDPNDKQGFPLGFGENHRIRPGQELDYLIRFQNTGTDTAFNIVIRDTLSLWLDPASVRPGAASHPYTWSLSGTGALQFTFANILLPDSTTDLAGSQGFVRFRVSQRPETPIGAQIFNEAAIYFDFNEPIITNKTLHTVGWDYLSAAPEQPGPTKQADRVTVSPNPVRDAAVFQRKDGQVFDGHRITVTNALGQVVWEERVWGKQAVFQRRGLPGGIYFFRVEDRGGVLVDAGRVVLE